MFSALYNLSFMEHADLVGILDGGQTVSNDESGSSLTKLVKGEKVGTLVHV